VSCANGTYFNGEVARGRPVSFEFTEAGSLRLTGEDLAEEIDLAHVRVSDRLGDVPRFVYLPGGAVIETPDNAMVDAAIGDCQRSRGSRLIHALESRQWIAALSCVLLVVGIIALGFYWPPALARVVAKRVSPEIDQRIGTGALATIGPYFSESALNAGERSRVEKQLARLQADPSVPRPRIEFRSMNGGLPNAFALPGNVIIVTDEFVRLPVNDDEIAAVLAHELGHLAKRHGLQSLLRNSFAVLIVASVTGDLSALTSFASTIPLTILTAGYSRDLEREADHYAFDLLRARGIKPRAFVTVLIKLEGARDTLKRNSTYLSTHPATDERTALFGGYTSAERQAVLAEPWIERATEAMSRDYPDEALVAYNRAIETNPTASTYALRAKCQLARHDYASADADASKALELDPKLADGYAARAQALTLGEKKHNEAIVAARKALELDPRNSSAIAILGYAETMKNDFVAAAADLDRAVKLSPSDADGWAFRGYLKQRRMEIAGALADYDEAIKLAPKTALIRYNRGVLRVQQKDFSGALSDFSVVTDPSQQTGEFFYERARAEQGMKKMALAIADYSRALDKGVSQSELGYIHLNRGIANAVTRDYKSAMADYDAAIRLRPKYGAAYFQRAIVHRELGNTVSAFADLDQALAAGFDEVSVTGERAEVNRTLGNYADALRDLNQVIEKRPAAHAYEVRAMIEFSMGDWERAEADLQLYLSIGKRRPQEYMEFFLLLTRRRRKIDDHQEAFTAMIAQWPDVWAKAVGRYLSGQISEARLLAETNTGNTPTKDERLCEAYFYIAEARLRSDDRASAEDFFEKCVRTGVTNYYEYQLARAELRHLHEQK
jgi:predicted Zn-dependent protease